MKFPRALMAAFALAAAAAKASGLVAQSIASAGLRGVTVAP